VVVALVALVATMASAGVPPECRLDAPGAREVRAVASGIVAADNRSDILQVMTLYVADAVLMPLGEAPVVGRDEIRPRYETLFASFTPEIELQIEEACVSGSLGFVRGHNGGRLISRASGEARLLDDVFVMLLRRESDGVWRISHLIWHRQSAAAPSPSGK
jgi:uncharacterized protein (TIGR02246 family)